MTTDSAHDAQTWAKTWADARVDDRNLAFLSHVGTLLTLVVSLGAANFLVPLIIWLARRDDEFVAANAKESLNFQITMLGFWLLLIPVSFLTFGLAHVVLFVLQVVLVIKAGLRAREGRTYRYPFCWRVLQ